MTMRSVTEAAIIALGDNANTNSIQVVNPAASPTFV
jgi:hypothetical protein